MKKRGLSPPKMPPLGSGGYRPNEKGDERRHPDGRSAAGGLVENFRAQCFARLLKEHMEHYEEMRDPAAHRKRIAATIDFEIAMRVAELKRCGVRNPGTQAKREAAKRWDHDTIENLNRWLRRNR